MYKRVPGTKDILLNEVYSWQRIEAISRDIFALYNYHEMRTPIIEEVALFNRSLGEFTEIVQKQMFLIRNQEDTYALRPEGTASIVRAYIENNLDKTDAFLKLYYIGPMFRLERPQKGRLRQFHHIGVEVIGSDQAAVDVEVIALADKLLKAYGASGYEIALNAIGCADDKKKLIEMLQQGLKPYLDNFCEECNRRFSRNVLRILDCKTAACRETLKNIDFKHQHLCQGCLEHFQQVKAGLDQLNIKYSVMPRLVRGLDYYTGTVFEIRHPELGAQDALCAGGRYDNLVQELGGPEAGAVGFAFGVERVLLIAKLPDNKKGDKKSVYVIPLGEQAKNKGLILLDELRKAGIPSDTDYQAKSLKGAMRAAGDYQADFVAIIGDNELNNRTVTLKNMQSGEQKEIPEEDLIKELKKC